ncbi:MAG TPA: hypothetical protein VEX41_08640, partial [Candidatus Eisenbacteria bacterium]|nr:hypothetical protein [Candidatus Eisenbacteria bacterium]
NPGLLRARSRGNADARRLDSLVERLTAAARLRNDRLVRELLREVPTLSGSAASAGSTPAEDAAR